MRLRVLFRGLSIALLVCVSLLVPYGVSAGEKLPLGLGSPLLPGKILGGETARRFIHLTFDDGPDARTTPQLLDILDRLGIKATFFFSASRFRDGQKRNAGARDLALEVKRRGHNIGSHSVDHKRMRSMRPAELKEQLSESDRLFTEIFGARTYLFRPPWGSHSETLDAMMATRKDTIVMWNLGMADWVKRAPEELVASFLRRMDHGEKEKGQRGGIVLMHDTHEWSVQSVPLLFDALAARNCDLLGRGEDLYDFVDDMSPWLEGGMATDKPSDEARKQLAARASRLREATKQRCEARASK
jgi:peptidoglycan/xylan/chitin deacetylase (PgdA/CDA1 family)